MLLLISTSSELFSKIWPAIYLTTHWIFIEPASNPMFQVRNFNREQNSLSNSDVQIIFLYYDENYYDSDVRDILHAFWLSSIYSFISSV